MNKKINLTCVECPMGCDIEVSMEGREILEVKGNSCPRGLLYAKNEVVCPKRVLTTTVRCENGKLLPVKTSAPIKKSNMLCYMQKVNSICAKTPVKIGEVILENIEEGVNLIATGNVE